MGEQCPHCETKIFPPRDICPGCDGNTKSLPAVTEKAGSEPDNPEMLAEEVHAYVSDPLAIPFVVASVAREIHDSLDEKAWRSGYYDKNAVWPWLEEQAQKKRESKK